MTKKIEQIKKEVLSTYLLNQVDRRLIDSFGPPLAIPDL